MKRIRVYPHLGMYDPLGDNSIGAESLAKCAKALYENSCKMGPLKAPTKNLNPHLLENKLIE